MKAIEAPEKIYISNFDIEALPRNEQLSERWHEVNTQDTDIEYTRTDTFIEKACGWLKENKDKYLYNTGEKGEYIPTCSDKIIDEFRKYMKGEKL